MRIIHEELSEDRKIMRERALTEGVSSYIIKSEQIEEIYGRSNIVLKIFKEPVKTLARAWWGKRLNKPSVINDVGDSKKDSTLIENTIVQNIAAFEGLAPRVYDLVLVESHGIQYAAQVTDYITGIPSEDVESLQPIIKFIHRNGIYARDLEPRNVINGKFFDFDGFALPDGYESYLRKKAAEVAHFNLPGDPAYQSIDKLKLRGLRDITGGTVGSYRVESLKLNKIDFENKKVLDVGCNLGLYCMEADLRGAKTVVGVDLPETAKIAREISNYLCHFNIDYLGTDLKRGFSQVPKEKYDIVFFMAMDLHIGGLSGDVLERCNDILIYESHRGADPAEREKYLKRKFRSVKYLGGFEDLGGGVRHQYICYKSR